MALKEGIGSTQMRLAVEIGHLVPDPQDENVPIPIRRTTVCLCDPKPTYHCVNVMTIAVVLVGAWACMTAGAVVVIENVWIPVGRDGCRLGARLFLPETAGPDRDAPTRHAVLLAYAPYGKNVWSASRDDRFKVLAERYGIAAVRADLRGSGESDDALPGEYLQTDQDDGLDAISWIREQRWAMPNSVFLYGAAWRGSNALQIAARCPPGRLAGIISTYSTDNRFLDNIPYQGGADLLSEDAPWASCMLAYNSRPPLPHFVDDAAEWVAKWRERLERTPWYLPGWLDHCEGDDGQFRRHASIDNDYAAVDVPVLLIGGFADGFANAAFRMARDLRSPTTALVGPWGHDGPDTAAPGPAIDWNNEIVEFVRDPLRRIRSLPRMRVFVRRWAMPDPAAAAWAGEFVGVDIDDIDHVVVDIGRRPGSESSVITVPWHLKCGSQSSGGWMRWGRTLYNARPGAQSHDDNCSSTFVVPMGSENVTLCGNPVLRFRYAASADAVLIARLTVVKRSNPAGPALHLSRGIAELPLQEGHLSMPMNAVGYVFDAAADVLLCSFSTSYFPLVFPVSRSDPLLSLGGVKLELPIVYRCRAVSIAAPNADDVTPSSSVMFAASEHVAGRKTTVSDAFISVSQWDRPPPVHDKALGVRYSEESAHEFKVEFADPLSARARSTWLADYHGVPSPAFHVTSEWFASVKASTTLERVHDAPDKFRMRDEISVQGGFVGGPLLVWSREYSRTACRKPATCGE